MARECYKTSFKSNLVHVEVVFFIDKVSCSYSQTMNGEASCSPTRDPSGSTPTQGSNHSTPTLDQSSLQEPKVEDLGEVQIHPDFPVHVMLIGAQLEAGRRAVLIAFLSEHHDCFAWSHTDMTGIYPLIITHRLQVDPTHVPVKQKRRKFAAEQNKIIDEEVHKLIKIGSIVKV